MKSQRVAPVLILLLGASPGWGWDPETPMETREEGPSAAICEAAVFTIVNSCGGRNGDPERGPVVMDGMPPTNVTDFSCREQVACLAAGLEREGAADAGPSSPEGRLTLLLRHLARTVGEGRRARGQWIRDLNTVLRAFPLVQTIRQGILDECGEDCSERSLAHFRTTGVSMLPDLLGARFCSGSPPRAESESYRRFVQAVERQYQQTLVGCGGRLGVRVPRDGAP